MMLTRRTVLLSSAAVLGAGALARLPVAFAQDGEGSFEITRTPEEWREILTPAQFAVLREERTECPHDERQACFNNNGPGLLGEVSQLNFEKRDGIFHCAGCDLEVYSSAQKYESGTGWPSFWDALPNAIRTKPDYKLATERTECHCRRCGGHFGHIFDDGPDPTGKRHCLNGLALYFVAA